MDELLWHVALILFTVFLAVDEDAEEANEDSPFMPSSIIPENEHLYIDDPKKALKGYFEREGGVLEIYRNYQ